MRLRQGRGVKWGREWRGGRYLGDKGANIPHVYIRPYVTHPDLGSAVLVFVLGFLLVRETVQIFFVTADDAR